MLVERESSTLLTQRLNSLLGQLPARQIEAITLRYYDEFSFAETAQIMGVSEKCGQEFHLPRPRAPSPKPRFRF